MKRIARPFSLSMTLPILAGVLLSGGVALAQSGGALGGFKVDTSQPIEISADALEVRQEQQTAIFTGSVDARQGTVRMQAQQLVVTYDPDSEAQGQAGAIRRVRAEGDVFVSSPEGAAQGNWADYDVSSSTILMGDTVTLTQGTENVLAGGSLSINLDTGFARIESGGVRADGTRERVRGIFFPSGDQ